jgi:hypothetical protein
MKPKLETAVPSGDGRTNSSKICGSTVKGRSKDGRRSGLGEKNVSVRWQHVRR